MGLVLVVLAWVFAGWLLIGVGALIGSRAFGFHPTRGAFCWWFWIGFAAVLAVGLLVHLVLPVSGWLLVALIPFAAAGWWLERPWRFRPKVGIVALVLFLALVAIVSSLALTHATAQDAGLYFVQSTLWVQRFRVVPGLADLHPCLGYNQTYFFWVAAFSGGPFSDRPWVVANGILFLAAACPGILALAQLVTRPAASVEPSDLLAAVLLAPLLDGVLSPWVSSPVPDAAVLCASVPLLAWLVEACSRSVPAAEARLVAAAAVVATTLKQPFACVTLPVAAVALWHARHEAARLAALLAAAALWGLGWLAHGVILSGYPLYPLPILGLPVDWRVPTEVAQVLTDYTRAAHQWRAASAALPLYRPDWPQRWLAYHWTLNREFLIPVAAFALALIALAVACARRQRAGPAVRFAVLATAALGLWWILVPDERFAGGLLWAAGFGILALLFPNREPARSLAWVLAVAVVVVGAFVGNGAPLGLRFSLPPPPLGTPKKYELAPGETVLISPDGTCFDLPCALRPYQSLRYRRPGDLRAGFRRPVAGTELP